MAAEFYLALFPMTPDFRHDKSAEPVLVIAPITLDHPDGVRARFANAAENFIAYLGEHPEVVHA